jgi:hypothetical protein
LSRILGATPENLKGHVTEIVGELSSLFADEWQYDLALFFQRCELKVVEYVQLLARKTANATAGRHATGSFTRLSSQPITEKSATKKLVGVTNYPDATNNGKRKTQDQQLGQDKRGKRRTDPKDWVLCHTCGNCHSIARTGECHLRNHPDANKDPNTKWTDSDSGKIYVMKMGGVSRPPNADEIPDYRIQRKGIRWGSRIINGEISIDSTCTGDIKPTY